MRLLRVEDCGNRVRLESFWRNRSNIFYTKTQSRWEWLEVEELWSVRFGIFARNRSNIFILKTQIDEIALELRGVCSRTL